MDMEQGKGSTGRRPVAFGGPPIGVHPQRLPTSFARGCPSFRRRFLAHLAQARAVLCLAGIKIGNEFALMLSKQTGSSIDDFVATGELTVDTPIQATVVGIRYGGGFRHARHAASTETK